MAMDRVLIIESFYGGSHKQMIEAIMSDLNEGSYEIITMSAKKWPWRARCSALHIFKLIPDLQNFKTLFCSSVLNLAELVGLCPKIAALKKVLYFHENQLIYPVKVIKERDFQFGYNQITSCLAADVVIFNSHFNMTSFLKNIIKFLRIMPDNQPKSLKEKIEKKCSVLYFPVCFKMIDNLRMAHEAKGLPNNRVLHLVWPHRWEFDKNPSLFFNALYYLLEHGVQFQVSILGESFTEIPEEFSLAKKKLQSNIVNYGFVSSREDYYKILIDADIVVSTADHEFFGVSMLEGVRCGCIPLAPNKLVYPEMYPTEYLYKTDEELFTKLRFWCEHPEAFAELKSKLNIIKTTSKFDAVNLIPQYLSILSTAYSPLQM